MRRLVLPGQEVSVNEGRRLFPRHHHRHAYAAVVVSGTCVEVGDRGRFAVTAGDVLLHRAFDGHADQIGGNGAVFVNFAWEGPLDARAGRVTDLDALLRAAERDPAEGQSELLRQIVPWDAGDADWPDLLAEELRHRHWTRLDQWSDQHGIRPESVSRGFRLAFGVSPKRYRLEQMASTAARLVCATDAPLSMIAAEAGFADQAHMTRSLATTFGVTPHRLRASC